MERRWVTEYIGLDGARYAGPIIKADCQQAAFAYLSVLEGPNAQTLSLTGELILQREVGENTESVVRRAS